MGNEPCIETEHIHVGICARAGYKIGYAQALADSEAYTVAQIREAFANHASRDDWGLPSFYEGGLIAALRGEYDKPSLPPGASA